MAFSLSDERDVHPVSVSYSPAASQLPVSVTLGLVSKQEDATVDADAIERWLTYPAKPEATKDEIPITISSPRRKVVDVAVRRRQQKMQVHQPSPSRLLERERDNKPQRAARIFQRTDLCHIRLTEQEQNNKEQKQSPLPFKLSPVMTRNDSIENSVLDRSSSLVSNGKNGKNGRKLSYGSDPLNHNHHHKNADDTKTILNAVSLENDEDCNPSEAVSNMLRDESNVHNNSDNSSGLKQIATTTADTTRSVSQNIDRYNEEDHRSLLHASGTVRGIFGTKVEKSGTSPTGISAIRRRRQKRLQRRELEKEQTQLEKEHHNNCESGNDSKIVERTPKHPVNIMASAAKISLVASGCQRGNTILQHDDGIENEYDDKNNIHQYSISIDSNQKVIAQNQRNSDLNYCRKRSGSRTKTIHLLKRHGDDISGNFVSKSISVLAGESGDIDTNVSHNFHIVTKEMTIHCNESPKPTIGRLQMIRRQKTSRDNRTALVQQTQHKDEYKDRSTIGSVDTSQLAKSLVGKHNHSRLHLEEGLENKIMIHNQHELQEQQLLQKLQIRAHANRQRRRRNTNKRPNKLKNIKDICTQDDIDVGKDKFNDFSNNNESLSYNTISNVRNLRRIKAALVRTRSHRRGSSKLNADFEENENISKLFSSVSNTGGTKKYDFQSRSIPRSSITEADTSLISVVSVDSSVQSNESQNHTYVDSHHDDNDDFLISYVSGTTSCCNETDGDENSKPISSTGSLDKRKSHDKSLNSSSDDERESANVILVEETSDPSFGRTNKPSEGQQQQLQLRENSNRIKLHVYDLVADDTKLDLWGCHFPLGQVFNAFNSSLHSIGTGAYHVGLEINGIEYAYGANSTKGLTGIFTCMPKCSPGYQFRTTLDFGTRVVLEKSIEGSNEIEEAVDGREIVRLMATDYIGTDYDLLRKNCCTFAHDACIRLGINEKEIPSWFHNLAAVGAVTQDAANYTFAPITQFFSGSELDKFTSYLNEKGLNDRLDVLQDVPSSVARDHEFIAETAYQF